MSTIEVAAERPYPVIIERGASERLGELAGDASRVAVLHPAVLAERAERLAADLGVPASLIEVPDAEAAKTPTVLARCWDRLAADGFTRSDLVVGLGGGATTDLAGFVAASWLRGVRLITIPTTVLGMVDAAVGGKTGINIAAGKNLVGAFWEPSGVLCDPALLDTLPRADLVAGLAEVIKCGLIADPEILDLIMDDPADAVRPDSARLTELITRGVAVKARVVSADLREATSEGTRVGRELLNYGHTLAHAIERVHEYRWRHGEAVAVGMVYAALLARRLRLADDALVDRHREVLAAVGLPTTGAGAGEWSGLRAAMALDKKARGAVLRFVLLDGLASARVVAGPDEAALAAAYRELGGDA